MEIKMSTSDDGKVVIGLVLEQNDADAITEYLFDGYCSLCGTGIPMHTKLCCQCLDEEIDNHRATHIHETFRQTYER